MSTIPPAAAGGLAALAMFVTGCQREDDAEGVSVTVSAIRSGNGNGAADPAGAAGNSNGDENGNGNVGAKKKPDKQIGATLSVTDQDGNAMDLSDDDCHVEVETRGKGGDWEAADGVKADKSAAPKLDVMLVADNSGSETGHAQEIQDAIDHFSHVLLARAHDDRVGLVRVSTASQVLQPLTVLESDMLTASKGLHISNGWTALWDGLRLANQELQAGAGVQVMDANAACGSTTYRSIVAFTDGQDNNSADEHKSANYPGDGVNTTAGDLLQLRIGGSQTPIYWVGVGGKTDEPALQTMASKTGGQYVGIKNYGGLVGALHGTAAKLKALVPVCFQPKECGHTEAKVKVTKKGVTTEKTFEFPDVCGDKENDKGK